MTYDATLDPDALLTTKQVAELRACSPQTIQRECQERRGIPPVIINRNTVRYRRLDVHDWIQLHRVDTTGEEQS